MRNYIYILTWFVLMAFPIIVEGQVNKPQKERSEGYKGIWFSLGQFSEFGDKYSGGLGTYTANHNPIAIYAPEVDKTFFVYGGTTQEDEKHLLLMLSYYDHKKGVVPKPVVVYDKLGVDDPHDNPSLSIDDEGHIWVFVSGRNVSRLGSIHKSRKPYEIDEFDQVYEGDLTYPQPWWVPGKGFLFMFTRYTNGRELYWSTNPDGNKWESAQKLASLGGQYQLSGMHNGKLVTSFVYLKGDNADTRTNLYVLQSDNMGETWKTMSGTPVQTPLNDIHNEALVKNYDAEGKLVYMNDLNFDKDGNPVILAIVSNHFQPGPKGSPREWQIIRWENDAWNITKVTTSTHNYDVGSLYIEGDCWKIIGPTEAGPQVHGTGGEVALWVSKDDGKSWKKKRNITKNSPRNHSYIRRPLNAHPDFYGFWADGNADELSKSKLYFTNKKGNKVWELPYSMDDDLAKPKRLR